MRSVRVIPMAALLVLLQTAVFPELRLFGVVPDVALLTAVSVAWTEGSEVGAWFGFLGGLAVDFVVSTPLGITAMAYAIVGYSVGLLHHTYERQVPLLTVLLGAVAGWVAGLIFVIVAVLTGADELQNMHSLKIVVAMGIYDAIVAIPVAALVRFAIREPRAFSRG